MHDRLGNELSEGDLVAFVTLSYKRAHLYTGVITSMLEEPQYKGATDTYDFVRVKYDSHGNTRGVTKLAGEVVKVQHEGTYDAIAHLERQHEFSVKTFGPGQRTPGVLNHIRKEVAEVEKEPDDLSEWIDLIILACDGAMRRGFTPEQVTAAWATKQAKNESREWPDWRLFSEDQAIEHVRS